MNKQNFLTRMLLLFALIVGSVNGAWAETKSVDVTPNDALNEGGVDPINISCAKGDGTSNPAISSGQLRLYQAGKGKTTGNTITFSSEKTIKKIVFTFANEMTASNGSFSEGSYDSGTSTWTGSTKSLTLTVTGTTSGTRIYITAMTVYYEDDGTPSTPSIDADDVNIAYNATNGSIEYTVNNPVAGGVLTAVEKVDADWLTLGSVNGSDVPFTTLTNDGAFDRVTTVTLTYTYNTIETVTKDVTITQNHQVRDYATLPFIWAGGTKAEMNALEGVETNADKSDYADSNAPYRVKFNGNGKYVIIKTDSQPGKVTMGVKMIGGDITSTMTIQESADGEAYTNVQDLSISGNTDDEVLLESNVPFKEETRYVKFLYTKGSNVGVGPIKITKTEPVEVTSAGYATYVSDNDLDYSGLDVKAYKALVDGKTISFSNVTTVPAGEGVLLQGAEGTYNVPVAASAVAAWADNDNAFVRGSDAAVASENGDGTYNYVLSTNNNVVGFYKAAGNTVAGNRAYLQSTYNEARLSFSFDDETGEATGISEMKNVKADAAIYNLNGVRVKNMTKGLYIMNGKKVIVK